MVLLPVCHYLCGIRVGLESLKVKEKKESYALIPKLLLNEHQAFIFVGNGKYNRNQ